MTLLAIGTMVIAHATMLWLGVAFFRREEGRGARRLAWIGAGNVVLTITALAMAAIVGPVGSAAGAAALLYAGAIVLMLAARAVHRAAPPDFIFGGHLPRTLVVRGPYRWVRHPFYLAYALLWTAGLLMTGGHGVFAVGAATMVFSLWLAARREEAQFLASPFAAAYREYQMRTGRILPLPWRTIGGVLRGQNVSISG